MRGQDRPNESARVDSTDSHGAAAGDNKKVDPDASAPLCEKTADDELAQKLVEYQAALVTGREIASTKTGAELDDCGTDAVFQQAQLCLRLLEHVRQTSFRDALGVDGCSVSSIEDSYALLADSIWHNGAGTEASNQPTNADGPPPKDRLRIGRFEIVRELGSGAHGIVLLARDPVLAAQRCTEGASARSLTDRRRAAAICAMRRRQPGFGIPTSWPFTKSASSVRSAISPRPSVMDRHLVSGLPNSPDRCNHDRRPNGYP